MAFYQNIDRQTNGRHNDANSRSYSVAVGSANKATKSMYS